MKNLEIVCKNCGTIDFYLTEVRGPHVSAICAGCGKFIKHLPQDIEFVIPFGKYVGRELSSMLSKDETNYLHWLYQQTFVKKNFKDKIKNHLNIVG